MSRRVRPQNLNQARVAIEWRSVVDRLEASRSQNTNAAPAVVYARNVGSQCDDGWPIPY